MCNILIENVSSVIGGEQRNNLKIKNQIKNIDRNY